MAKYQVRAGQTSTGILLYESDTMHVSKGGTANETGVYAGGSMYLSSGGTANSTGVFSNGSMYVRGTANATSAYIGGTVEVTTKFGVANDTLVNGVGSATTLKISNGGVANNTTVLSAGVVEVSVGGTANVTSINGTCTMSVSSGGIANFTTVNEGGSMTVSTGGVANDTSIYFGGVLVVEQNGNVSDVFVNEGGSMTVSTGGVANNLIVNCNGTLDVETGAYATIAYNPWVGNINFSDGAYITYLDRDASVYFGGNESGLIAKAEYMSSLTVADGKSLIVYSAGRVDNTFVGNGGTVTVYAGGAAFGTTVNSSGVAAIFAGGAAYGNGVWDGGDMVIYAGAAAAYTFVNEGGEFAVTTGGTTSNTTISDKGSMYVYDGGKICGSLQMADQAFVSVNSGATIDFTVANQTVPASALINNWSLISGRYDVSYTITVNANQACGAYVLAGGASDFNSTITINDTDGTARGTISVGQRKCLAGRDYALYKNDDALVLNIGRIPVSNYNATAKSDVLHVAGDGSVYVLRDTEDGYKWTGAVNNITGWKLVGTRRDVTGDGLTDVQITCDSGNVTYVAALRNECGTYGDVALNYSQIGCFDNRLWNYLGSADVNGDGKAEVMIAQTEAGLDQGTQHVLAMITDECGVCVNYSWVGGLSGNWGVTGVADVDGNGTDNIILRRADGMIGYWSEAGTNDIVEVWNVGGSTMLTSGDFTGDGADDILWTNAAGDFYTWNNIASGLTATRIGNAGDLGGMWSFADVGDYNGDGKDEILWRNGVTGSLSYGYATADNFANLTQIA